MERIVKLSNFSSEIELSENCIASISNNLKCLCVLSTTGCAYVYSISRSNESVPFQRLIWESSFKVHSFSFSEDGNHLMVISDTKTFQIFELCDDGIKLLSEKDIDEVSISLGKNGIEFSASVKVTPQVFQKGHAVLFIDSMWLVSLKWYHSEPVVVTNKIELPSCVTTVTCRSVMYSLTLGGNVSAYSLEDGKQLGVVNLYSLVPRGNSSEVQVFANMAVSLDGAVLAVADRASQVFLANIKCHFLTSDQQEESYRWDCGASIISTSSATSRASVRTTASLLRLQPMVSDNVSLSAFEFSDKEKLTSYKSNWNSYLKTLQQKSACSAPDAVSECSSRSRLKLATKVEDSGSTLRQITSLPAGLTVHSLHINSAGLSVWYTEPEAAAGGVYRLHDLASGTCTAEVVVPNNAIVIPGGFSGLLDAFLSPTSLWLFLGNLSRDVLVSKLLHCVETESIGQLLQGEEWGDLVVPLPALANGLKQQQMDVARLALGLHAQAFKSAFVKTPSEDDVTWQLKIDTISTNMDKLFNTIHDAIHENAHKVTFLEHLVLLSLHHANDLLNFLHESTLSALFKGTIKEVVKRVMYHVVELRRHLYKRFRGRDEESKEHQPLSYLGPELQGVWERWQALKDEEVVRDAVSGGNIPLAQVFLLSSRSWNHDGFQACFREQVHVWIQQLLTNKEIEEVKQIFINLGCEPYEELNKVCKQSLNKDLRDNLAQHLSDQGLLKPVDIEAWTFLRKMESILEYVKLPSPCKFSQDIVSIPQNSVLMCDVPVDLENCGSLSIATVTQQSRVWRDTVLVDLFFNIPGTSLEKVINPELVWQYLLRHNREDLIITWIDCYFHKDTLTQHTFTSITGLLAWVESLKEVSFKEGAQIKELLTADDMLKIFASWEISQIMVDSVCSLDSMQRTKDLVLDHLSRFGIFNSSDRQKPNAILSRLIRTRLLHNLKQTLQQSTSNVTYEEFQDLLTTLVIKYELHNVPFACLKDCEFSEEKVQALCLPPSSSFAAYNEQGLHWFQLWLAFRQLNKNPSDEELIHQTIVKSAQYLGGGDLQKYLQEHPLIVLAMIIFSSHSVSDVFLKEGCVDLSLSKDTLEATLKQLPPLEIALSSLHNHSKQKADVSVYQLLHGCTQFDTSKLFGWQEMHLIEGEEFPHFASSKLIDRYGSKHTLTYLHYLKQARPSFAVNKFIVNQFKSHGKLSPKMVKQACNFAHGLALQNFDDTGIKCACIAFIEMLGRDSEAVRVHAAAANKILNYLDHKVPGSADHHNIHKEKVGALLYGLVRNNMQSAFEMLMLVQEALEYDFAPQSSSKDDADSSRKFVRAMLHWDLAVKFARIHRLKLPEMFLRQCAARDEWLQFVVFAQLYSYPVEQVMQLVGVFHSPVLREHLFHALGHNVSKQPERSKPKFTTRDSRKMLYSRIGLKKGESNTENLSDSQSTADDALSIHVSSTSSEDSPQSHVTVDMVGPTAENDVFHTLLKCHRSSDPPRALLAACQNLGNPVLAVLATCYEPSSVLSCFCIWLLTSLSDLVKKRLRVELSSALQQHLWFAENVEKLLEETTSSGYVTTLTRGFRLFLCDNPLCAFSEFLYECVVKKNFKQSIISIKLFKATYLNLRNNVLLQEQDNFEGTFMNNGYWVASVAVRLVGIALAKCFSSAYHQLQFLYTLQEAKFTDHLPVNAPDLALLTGLLECLSGTEVSLDMDIMCLHEEEQAHKQELLQCLHKLVLEKHYYQGLQLASLADLPKDTVLLAQWSDNFEHHFAQRKSLGTEYINFWNKCHGEFKEAKVKPCTAGKFFQDHAEKVEDCKERYHILQLALQWFHHAATEEEAGQSRNQEMAAVELEMWTCWLKADPDLQITSESTMPMLLYSLKSDVLKASDISSLSTPTTLNDEQEKKKLNSLIGKLLDQGDVATACRIEVMFNHKNQDLQILLTCMSLAEGEMTPYQLTTEHRLLLSETPSIPTTSYSYRRRTLLSSVSSMSHSPLNCSISSDYVEIPSRDRQDTVVVLEKLTERMAYGRNVGRRVVTCYRVAMNLEKNYQEIIALRDPLPFLKTAIADDCMNKFIVASDLMTAAQTSREEVAEFLCGEIVSAITRSNTQGEVDGKYMWGCDLDANFHLVLEICDDPSTLGSKLLAVATQLGTNQLEAIHEAVELTIRAHDCYTAACNMEGIAAVLQKARTLTSCLQNRLEWALMVRLLTGVGRYTEMNYIFRILQENDQFEFLLGKGLDKVPGLKMAVLDFLKLYCPEDLKLFQIAALHFALFGEVAISWANDGKSRIDSLLAVARLGQPVDAPVLLSNTDDTKQCLHMAVECFRHAAEFYLQANKLTRAMSSAHQAELVALQIAVVSSVPAGQCADSLLKLNAQQVSNVISNKLSFPEACIVARAYSHPVDWGAALYQHCIVHREASYLSDFTHNMTLTTALVEDVARRFQMDSNVTQEMALEMKKFVQCVSSVEVKYRVASQLGYRDIIESLLNGPEVAYLKDTVWLRGFRR